MIKLWGLKNCDSCRKALKALQAENQDVELNDVREHPPGSTRLNKWLREFGADKLVNRRSTTWRTLSEAERALDNNKAVVALLETHPALMKRPLIESGKQLHLGFNDATLEALKSS